MTDDLLLEAKPPAEWQGFKILWDYIPRWIEDPPDSGGQDQDQDQDQDQTPNPDPEGDGEGEPEPEGKDQLDDDEGNEGFDDDETDDDFDPDGDEEIGTEPEPEPSPISWGIVEPDKPSDEIPGLTIIRGEYGSTFHRQFRSWYEFVTSAARDDLYRWKNRNTTSRHASHKLGDEKWSGTPNFASAVKMAIHTGWPEGRKMLSEMITAVAPRPQVYNTWQFDVAGAFPCVPLFCAGDPAAMVIDPGSDLRAAKPIIRIDYNHWVHAGVSIKSMMLRGAAVVSLANSLEKRGFSTELRIVGNSRSRNIFRYSIVYKKAGEPLDLDRAAFAIAHPSSMRRLAFAILEQHEELLDLSGGYGMPMYEANDPNPNTIFIPGSHGTETIESAKKAVEKAAESLLTQIGTER